MRAAPSCIRNHAQQRGRIFTHMKALTVSIIALVALAGVVALLAPGSTAGAVLALGTPFVLFANVMATDDVFSSDA